MHKDAIVNAIDRRRYNYVAFRMSPDHNQGSHVLGVHVAIMAAEVWILWVDNDFLQQRGVTLITSVS